MVNDIKQGDIITRLEIIRIGDKAKAFKADQASFDRLLNELDKDKAAKATESREKDMALIKEKWPNVQTTASGLMYEVVTEGSGSVKPRTGDTVSAHYTGMFLDGRKFDSSVDRGEPDPFSGWHRQGNQGLG